MVVDSEIVFNSNQILHVGGLTALEKGDYSFFYQHLPNFLASFPHFSTLFLVLKLSCEYRGGVS